jgi:spermidine/putrescine transport system substrate-binding protein
MMFHPKDVRGRMSRRALLERGAGFAVAGSFLAACANTTDVKSTAGGATGQAGEVVTTQGTSTAPAVPLGPGGIPIATRDRPVKLPTYNLTPIDSNLPLEDGPLKVYNWDQYIDPEVVKKFEKQFKKKVTITTYQNEDEAMAKLQSGSVDFDVYFPSVTRLPILVSRRMLRPLNHDYVPNLARNVWPELVNPFYDVGAQYAVPYTVFGTGIVWRNDKVKEDISKLPNPWTALWDVGPHYKGKVAILDDPREALGIALFRNGETDVNTEDPVKVAKALQSLKELDQAVGVKVSIAQYQTVPEGQILLAQDWSGDQIAGALYYLPQGVKPNVLSFWKPPIADPAANDLIAVLSTGKNPVLAHTFLNFMLDETNAYNNFANFNGYQPPMNNLDFATLQSKLGLPDSIAPAIMQRSDFATGLYYQTLTPTGKALYDKAWADFRAG